MTSYGLRADTIVGYTFKAETLCPACTFKAVLADLRIDGPLGTKAATDLWNEDTEAMLDFFAPICDPPVDRQDEYTFDSDDFPKVLFSAFLDEDEACCNCSRWLLSDR